MKKLILALSLLSSMAFAQKVGVKDIPAGEDTTIEIKKGSRSDIVWEVTEGSDEIEGDAAPLLQTARANWKTACADWKKEVKDLNKENPVLALNCGRMQCVTEAMESTCRSTGKYKIKVRVK
ncbi:hypothetical protein D3C87_88890 [compost metagenome]